MFRPILLACAVLSLAGAASAGDITQPAPDPVIAAPVTLPSPAATDWSGFYLGVQTGYGSYDDPGPSASGPVYGLHAGYQRDLGGFVAGTELRYDDLSALAGVTDRVTMLTGEVRLGYSLGRVLPYVAIGGAQVRNNTRGTTATGQVFGLGADFAISDQWRIGAEATRADLDWDDGFGPLTGTNLGLSVSFSF